MNDLKIFLSHDRQSWEDISLTLYGVADYAFELALLNEKSPTDTILAGENILFDPKIKNNPTILTIYENQKTIPCTAFSTEDIQILDKQEGISIWAINIDFAVSHGGQ